MPREPAASVLFAARAGRRRFFTPMDPLLLGLPHRDPFRFVDEVLEIEPGISARGRKTFSGEEAFFAGHFPGHPIVPGVILTEALAQLAGIVGASTGSGGTFLLSAVRLMKFLRSARPREAIELHAATAGQLGDLLRFEVSARVGDLAVAQGEIMLCRAAGNFSDFEDAPRAC